MSRASDVSKHFTGGNPVIYVDTIADLQALDTSGLVEGQAASVQGSEFRWDGGEWRPVGAVSVRAFGLGFSDDTSSVQDALDYAQSQGVPLRGCLDRIPITGITIPLGSRLEGDFYFEAIELEGGLDIEIEGDVKINHLDIHYPEGHFKTTSIVVKGEGVEIDKIHRHADGELDALCRMAVFASNFRCREKTTRWISRPLTCSGWDGENESVPIKNIHVGSLIVSKYRVGLGISDIEDSSFGFIKMFDVDPRAPVSSSAQMGCLISSCRRVSFGTYWAVETGSSAVRIGGTAGVYTGNTEDLHFDKLIADGPHGNAFKINPTFPEIAKNITIGSLIGIDVGRGSSSRNNELLRVSGVDGLSIANLFCEKRDFDFSVNRAISMNNVKNFSIGNANLSDVNSSFFELNDAIDNAIGDADSITIGSITGNLLSVGGRALVFNYTDEVGVGVIKSVYIGSMNVTFTDDQPHFATFRTGTLDNFEGPVYFSAQVPSGKAVTVENPAQNMTYEIRRDGDVYRKGNVIEAT